MASYYKKIRGKNYDRELIDLADTSIEGKGDGRISLNDAKALLRAVKDADTYTDVEKRTMRYIRDKYKFTPEADKWFRKEIRSWAALRSSSKSAATKPSKKASRKKAPKRAKAKTAAKPKKAPSTTSSDDTTAPTAGAVAALLSPNTAASDVPEPSPVLLQEQEYRDKEAEKGQPAYWKALIVIPVLLIAYLAHYLVNESRKPSQQSAISEKEQATDELDKLTAKVPRQKKEKEEQTLSADEILSKVQVEGMSVTFRRGSFTVSGRDRKRLRLIVGYLKATPDAKLTIVGHTCHLGGPRINKPLSLRRAKQVARVLLKSGIRKSQIETVGKGQSKPIASNKSAKGRRRNRRVQFLVTL